MAVIIGEYRLSDLLFAWRGSQASEWDARFSKLGKSVSTIRMVRKMVDDIKIESEVAQLPRGYQILSQAQRFPQSQ